MPNYGAIAYSVTTKQFGYSYGWSEPDEAQRVAMQSCKASDALLLCCECDCWIALTQSESSKAYGWAYATSWKDASRHAIAECNKYVSDPELIVCFSTLDGQQMPYFAEAVNSTPVTSKMNLKQLEQNLQLPNITASLVVYRDAAQKSKWYIRFLVPGYDGRYNPGIAVISSSKVNRLIDILNKAYEKMELLEKAQYTGRFSEEIVPFGEISDTFSVTISSKKAHFLFWSYKEIRLHFLVSSKTNTFSRSFDLNDAKTVINKLSSAECSASKLVKQLQS